MDEFAKTVQSDPKLAGGFNVVGLSQGGLVVRGYIQQYNNPPVYDWGAAGALPWLAMLTVPVGDVLLHQAQLCVYLRRAEWRVQLPPGSADHPFLVRLVQEQPLPVRAAALGVGYAPVF